jgi:glyoxylase-like metal-dependent hydrolase (beta-lactamase superfamily II)
MMQSVDIFPEISGKVDEYDIIVVGHLRYNRYYGETNDPAPRGDPSTCTSTLISGKDKEGNFYRLLIDPTLRWTAAEYYFDLNRRTGLHPKDITHCFVTHAHFDHIEGLAYFPDAKWLTSKSALPEVWGYKKLDCRRTEGVEGEFLPGLYVIPLPGHTLSLHGIAFYFAGKKYLVAGDSLMSKHHLRHETCEFETDPQLARQTIRAIKASFDLVIPGHDNIECIR